MKRWGENVCGAGDRADEATDVLQSPFLSPHLDFQIIPPNHLTKTSNVLRDVSENERY